MPMAPKRAIDSRSRTAATRASASSSSSPADAAAPKLTLHRFSLILTAHHFRSRLS
jgi:hypothetical protein